MNYIKLYEEYFTPEEKKEAEYKRRNAKRYPSMHWKIPDVKVTIDKFTEINMRREWDVLRDQMEKDVFLRKSIEDILSKKGLDLNILKFEGYMLPIEFVQILFEELVLKPQQMMQKQKGIPKPTNVPQEQKQKRKLGFQFKGSKDVIGSENE
jgi:hypothetical protein